LADGQVRGADGGPGDASSFPRRHARTRGFTLGRPRGFQVGADGARVAFLRSAAGDDPVNRLWVLELASGAERLVADPARLLGGDPGDVPPEERARRERARERAGGIVAFAADLDLTVASFALAGRLFVADLVGPGGVRELPAGEGVLDPRVDPSGARVAWVADRALHVAPLGDAGAGRRLAGEDDPEVSWGLAEFVAAEEMGRTRGFWWAPDGERLAVARVDLAKVRRLYLADPTNPAIEPVRLPYPAAGTANAQVSLHMVDLEGRRVEVRRTWPRSCGRPAAPSPCWSSPVTRRPPWSWPPTPAPGRPPPWPPSTTRPGSTSSAACRRGWTAGWS
jgi:dipeptidyl-peptidase 4